MKQFVSHGTGEIDLAEFRRIGTNVIFERGAMVFHAGTAQHGQDIVTAGGRVLGITGRGNSLAEAQAAAYRAAKQIAFKGCHYRHDIAYRALAPRG